MLLRLDQTADVPQAERGGKQGCHQPHSCLQSVQVVISGGVFALKYTVPFAFSSA